MEGMRSDLDQNCGGESTKEAAGTQALSGEGDGSVILNVPCLEATVPSCRICYCGPNRGRLLKPCKCKGTIKFVHRCCLERWLETTNNKVCELCQYRFTTERTRKSALDWCHQPETADHRRKFLGDFFCFGLLTPLGVAAFWVCLEGAIYYSGVENSALESASLFTLAVLLAMAYLTWIVLCSRYHWVVFSRWRNTNFHVHVVDREEEEEDPPSGACEDPARIFYTPPPHAPQPFPDHSQTPDSGNVATMPETDSSSSGDSIV